MTHEQFLAEFNQERSTFAAQVKAEVATTGTMDINGDEWLQYLRENNLRPVDHEMVEVEPGRWVLGIKVVNR